MVLNEIIFIVEDDPEGGLTARALNNSIYTEADTIDELKICILDAVKCHYDSLDNILIRLHIVREEVLSCA